MEEVEDNRLLIFDDMNARIENKRKKMNEEHGEFTFIGRRSKLVIDYGLVNNETREPI